MLKSLRISQVVSEFWRIRDLDASRHTDFTYSICEFVFQVFPQIPLLRRKVVSSIRESLDPVFDVWIVEILKCKGDSVESRHLEVYQFFTSIAFPNIPTITTTTTSWVVAPTVIPLTLASSIIERCGLRAMFFKQETCIKLRSRLSIALPCWSLIKVV